MRLAVNSRTFDRVGIAPPRLCYRAFGLAVCSDFPLPELIHAPEVLSHPDGALRPEGTTQPDITIRRGCLQQSPTETTSFGTPFCLTADGICLFYEAAGKFLIRDGREIVVDSPSDCTDRAESQAVRLVLLGPAFGLLLHQRGLLALHAGAVGFRARCADPGSIDRGAALFLGFPGAGKSTMVAALLDRGHSLIADDIAAVCFPDEARPTAKSTSSTTASVHEAHEQELAGGRRENLVGNPLLALPVVLPAFPQMKLWPEAAHSLGIPDRALPALHPDLQKRGWRVEQQFAESPLPVRRIYVITEGNALTIDRLEPQKAVIELVRHTYSARFLAPTRRHSSHLRQCAHLAGTAPVCRLTRPRSLERVTEIAELVEADFDRAL